MMFAPIAGLIWKTLVLKLGIDWLRPSDDPRARPATFSSLMWLVMAFTAAGTLLSALGFLALPVKLIGWGMWTLAWFAIFGYAYGLGIFRTVALYLISALGQVVFRLALRFSPFVEPSEVNEAFAMWHVMLSQ